MISENIIKALGGAAADARSLAGESLFYASMLGHADRFVSKAEQAEALAAEYTQVADICRLLNTDPHLRDAVADAQSRQSAPVDTAASVSWWDRVAAEMRRRAGVESLGGPALLPEHLDLLVQIAGEMRGEAEPPADPLIGSGELAWDVQQQNEDGTWSPNQIDYDVNGWEPDVLASLMVSELAWCLSDRPELNYYGKTVRVRVWDASRGADTAQVALIGAHPCDECGETAGVIDFEVGWFCPAHGNVNVTPVTDVADEPDAAPLDAKPAHGTEEGYWAHRKRKEPICAACCDAHDYGHDATPLDASDAEAAEVEIS